jgi:hypothetical protein
MDPRAAVIAALVRLARSGRGTLLLPALPAPVEVRASRHALHLPHEPLAAGSPVARVAAALASLPLHVP